MQIVFSTSERIVQLTVFRNFLLWVDLLVSNEINESILALLNQSQKSVRIQNFTNFVCRFLIKLNEFINAI